MSLKKIIVFLLLFVVSAGLWGCRGALQRGMMGDTYISTARPKISITVKDMPLMISGSGIANLEWTGMMGGLPVNMWIAVYGQGGLAPLAIVAQAQTPQNWYWDGILSQPFSVDQTTETFNGVNYQACTFIINPATDPFGDLVTGITPEGEPQQWIVRYYAARYNFNNDKIILEYREPLPQAITSLTGMPLGYANYLVEFAQRARESFIVANLPADINNVVEQGIQGVRWQYMNQRFLGTASRYETLTFR